MTRSRRTQDELASYYEGLAREIREKQAKASLFAQNALYRRIRRTARDLRSMSQEPGFEPSLISSIAVLESWASSIEIGAKK